MTPAVGGELLWHPCMEAMCPEPPWLLHTNWAWCDETSPEGSAVVQFLPSCHLEGPWEQLAFWRSTPPQPNQEHHEVQLVICGLVYRAVFSREQLSFHAFTRNADGGIDIIVGRRLPEPDGATAQHPLAIMQVNHCPQSPMQSEHLRVARR